MARTPSVLHVMWQMSHGGAERAVYQLIREQRRRAVLADVALGDQPGTYGERLQESGVHVHELRCRGAWDVVRSSRLTAIARQYEIVHVHGIEPLLIAAVARSGSRLVYTHRGGVRDYGRVKRFRLMLARTLVRRFDAISANTRQSARAASRWLGIPLEDVRVIYNGLDFALLEPSRSPTEVRGELPDWPGGTLLVGTAANLQTWKRVDRLLEAVARFGEGVNCIVLGEGPARPGLERRAAELGIPDRVAFVGWKKHVGDYIQLLDAFVLPSGPEEAFGNAAVEAMGLGIPTVVFEDGGGLVEHVVDRKTGLVVSDTDDLARALSELAADPALRMQVGGAGGRYARETYSLDAMFAGYDALYREALAT